MEKRSDSSARRSLQAKAQAAGAARLEQLPLSPCMESGSRAVRPDGARRARDIVAQRLRLTATWRNGDERDGRARRSAGAGHRGEYELGPLVDRGVIAQEAWNEYLRCIGDPAAIHAMCEDYRAGASIDLEHDRSDLDRQVTCPLLVLWGGENPIWKRFDMLDTWSQRAVNVTGEALPCGHYLAEEAPDATYARLHAFFSE
jgi:pimeloyl-ACP methyl ester carboxylesterase